MICHVHGILVEKEPTRVVIEAAGIGYELLVPLSTFDRLPHVGEEVKLLAAHCVREDDELLFGFFSAAERTLFSQLTSVSGVGPKIAIAILSGSSVNELSLAIARGDAKRLSSIKGVGKKTAEKICVELKDKVDALEALSGVSAAATGNPAAANLRDAVLALAALGFNEETANKMVSQVLAVDPTVRETDRIVRLALSGR